MTDFSLVDGGPLRRVCAALGLTDGWLSRRLPRAVLFALLAWVPLAILAAAQHRATGWPGALLEDFQVYARCWVAIPILVLADVLIERRTAGALRYLGDAQLITEENRDAVTRAVGWAKKLRDSPAELFVLVTVVVMTAYAEHELVLAQVPLTWRSIPHDGGTAISWAALWYALVTTPIFLFLLFRWIWRFLVWTFLLQRLARAPLHVVPTHPDEAGGLGPIVDAHASFYWIVLALSAVLAAAIANQAHRYSQSVLEFRHTMGLFVVVFTGLALAPLLLFAPFLVRTRRAFLREYGAKASDYSSRFEQRWVRSKDPIDLGTSDVQTDSDLGTSFQRAEKMRVLLVLKREAWCPPLAAALLPMVLVLMREIPLVEILKQVAGLVG